MGSPDLCACCARPQQAQSLFQQASWQQGSQVSGAGGRPRCPVASPLHVRLFMQSLMQQIGGKDRMQQTLWWSLQCHMQQLASCSLRTAGVPASGRWNSRQLALLGLCPM